MSERLNDPIRNPLFQPNDGSDAEVAVQRRHPERLAAQAVSHVASCSVRLAEVVLTATAVISAETGSYVITPATGKLVTGTNNPQVVIGPSVTGLPRWLDLMRYFLPREWRDRVELIFGDIVELRGKNWPDWVVCVAVVCNLVLTFARQVWNLVRDLIRLFIL